MDKYIAFIANNVTTTITVITLILVFTEWAILAAGGKVERHKEGWVSLISAGLAFFPIFLLGDEKL